MNTASSSAGYNTNVKIENNILMTRESGFVVYFFDADGVVMANNILWPGTFGGLAMGDNLYNIQVANNVLHSINFAHSGVPYNPSQHQFQNNLIGTTAHQSTPLAISGGFNNFIERNPRFANIPDLDVFFPPSNDPNGLPPSHWRQDGSSSPRFGWEDFCRSLEAHLSMQAILHSHLTKILVELYDHREPKLILEL